MCVRERDGQREREEGKVTERERERERESLGVEHMALQWASGGLKA